MDLIIRYAVEEDILLLTTIFNYHVESGHSTLRPGPEPLDKRLEAFRRTSTSGRYQMLVAESDGILIGSASSFRFRDGPVFEKTVEFGIYLDPNFLGKGIGTSLYLTLIEKLSGEDVHLAVAGIALPNPGSVALHKKVGFEEVGVFDEYAFYKGKYFSSMWMQRRFL